MEQPKNFRAGTRPAKHQFTSNQKPNTAPAKTPSTPIESFEAAVGKQNSDGYFEVTLPGGREMVLRPLPPHFYMIYGQLPDYLPARAIEALAARNAEEINEALQEVPPENIAKVALMLREAVKYIAVVPKVGMEAKGTEQIAMIDLSAEEFSYLQGWAIYQSTGGEAQRAATFRR